MLPDLKVDSLRDTIGTLSNFFTRYVNLPSFHILFDEYKINPLRFHLMTDITMLLRERSPLNGCLVT